MVDYIDKKKVLLNSLLEIARNEAKTPYFDKKVISLEFELKTGLSHRTALKYIDLWVSTGILEVQE